MGSEASSSASGRGLVARTWEAPGERSVAGPLASRGAGTVSRGLTVHALTPAMPGKCSLQSRLLSASPGGPAASSPLPVTHKWLIQGTTDLSSAGPRVYGSHLGVSLRSYRERKPGSLGASG